LSDDDDDQSVDEKICERWFFTISEVLYELTQILGTVLNEIITVRLGCHKFCTRRVPEILTGVHKTQTIMSALSFLEQYHEGGDELLSHIIQVTGDETWI
jgi:hypothetical protein